jgi:hypothetical protein
MHDKMQKHRNVFLNNFASVVKLNFTKKIVQNSKNFDKFHEFLIDIIFECWLSPLIEVTVNIFMEQKKILTLLKMDIYFINNIPYNFKYAHNSLSSEISSCCKWHLFKYLKYNQL